MLMLAACGGYGAVNGGGSAGVAASDGNEEVVCAEQSSWAQSGKYDGGDITITCPGDTRPAY